MTPTRRCSVPATPDEVSAHFGREVPLVGMIHLLPLPGSPRWTGTMRAVIDRARADATALAEGGMDGVLVENFGDLPFRARRVGPETVAAMALAVDAIRDTLGDDLPVGVNVLRNDARSAVALAAVTGASFVRVNVHTGTMFTDQGFLEGHARDTLERRARLAPDLLLLADVLVKHATPPPGVDAGLAAKDLRHRGLADVLVVSGARTGAPVDPIRLRAVRDAAPAAPVWVGSGIHADNTEELLRVAHGAIVGSALQHGGKAGSGVDPERVRRLVAAARG